MINSNYTNLKTTDLITQHKKHVLNDLDKIQPKFVKLAFDANIQLQNRIIRFYLQGHSGMNISICMLA